MRKSDILDADADNMAVRMALGETKIIDETKKALEKEGVRISAFEGMHRNTPRSKTALLVKNIPHDTLASEGAVYPVRPFRSMPPSTHSLLSDPSAGVVSVFWDDSPTGHVLFFPAGYCSPPSTYRFG